MSKRGVSGVIVSVLIILAVIVAVGILWSSVEGVFTGGSNFDPSLLTSNFVVLPESISIDSFSHVVDFRVKREAGEGNVVAFNIVLEDVNGNSFGTRIDEAINELENREFKVFFNGTSLEGNELRSISVYPIIELENGEEVQSTIPEVYDFTGQEFFVSCGDLMVQGAEECDGSVGSLECGDFSGYIPGQGTLSCGVNCMFDFSGCILQDQDPPSSVTNLVNVSNGDSWITWTWNNPGDIDFVEALVYLDGVNVVNTSLGEYNATGLMNDSSYTLRVETIDSSGNINDTLVDSTATTLPPNPLFLGLVAHWSFDNDLGGVAIDETGHWNGTYNSSAYSDNVDCVSGGCAKFDGIAGVIEIADLNNSNYAVRDFSIATWMRYHYTDDGIGGISGEDQSPFYHRDGSNFVRLLAQNPNNRTNIYYRENFNGTTDTLSMSGTTNTLPPDVWFYWVIVKNGTGLFSYIDGTLEKSHSVSVFEEIHFETEAYIGAYRTAGSNQVNGTIDELKIYNKSLSDVDVLNLYNLYTHP